MIYEYSTEKIEKGIVFTIYTDFGELVFAKRYNALKDKTEEEIVKDILFDYFESSIENNELLPLPLLGNEQAVKVEFPVKVELKIHLINEFIKSGLTKKELSDKLNIHQSSMGRFLDLRKEAKIETLEKIFNALGKRIEIVIKG